MPGGRKESLRPVLPEENGHPALGRHRSGNNSVAGLATPVRGAKNTIILFLID